jgi:uncharacterized repeat protein (TIGR01451 family)
MQPNESIEEDLMKRGFSLTLIIALALLPALFGPVTWPASAQAQAQADVDWGYIAGNVYTTPQSHDSFTDLVAVAAGYSHILLLRSDGTVWAKGNNRHGLLGDGTTTSTFRPVQVSDLAGITAIAAGAEHSLAVKGDGTVWAWGQNNAGQLGNGSTIDSLTPVQVSDLTNVVAVQAGFAHSLALKSDGTVWAWGENSRGELGNGSTADSLTPVQVNTLTGVTDIAVGDGHGLARKTDGTVWAWGANFAGQLGDGTTTDSLTPIQVSGLTGSTDVAAGRSHSLALRSDGTMWAWGANELGQLGDGSRTNSDTPVQVSSLVHATAIAAGGQTSLALILTPVAVLSSMSLNFGDQLVGTTASQQITLTNGGSAPLIFYGLAISAASDFRYGASCGSNQSLAVGASCTIDIRFTPTVPGIRSATLYVFHNAPGNQHAIALTGNGVPSADLALSLGADQNPVRSATNLTYLITIQNAGPTAASGVVVGEPLPAGTTFVSATPSQGSCITPAPGAIGTMTCNLGGMANGASATVKLVVKVTAAGGATLSNTASVSASSNDPNNANNAATLTTRVFGAKH